MIRQPFGIRRTKRDDFGPEGRLIIARRFIAGEEFLSSRDLENRDEQTSMGFDCLGGDLDLA